MFSGLVINPAYAGVDEALSLTFIHRNQWSGVENAPSTQTLAAHTLVSKKHLGLGLTIVNDKIGVHKNQSILTNYAYHIRTGERSVLSMGLQAGLHSAKSDYASLMSGATSDPKINNLVVEERYVNFGMGFYFRSPALHVGFSVPELVPQQIFLNDTVSLDLSRTNFFLFSRYTITPNERIAYQPAILLKYLPGLPLSFDVACNMIYRKVLTLGLSYRKCESVDFLFKAQVTPQLQLGYGYDHTIGDISRLSNGSHELMVQYLFRYVETKVSSPR